MLGGREEHSALLLTAAACCVLGSMVLVAGVFMFYRDELHYKQAFGMACVGSLLFFVGMAVGRYTKKRSSR